MPKTWLFRLCMILLRCPGQPWRFDVHNKRRARELPHNPAYLATCRSSKGLIGAKPSGPQDDR